MRAAVLTLATLSSVSRKISGVITENNDKNLVTSDQQLRRGLRFDEDSMQETPCVKPDGSLSAPNEFFGDGDDNFYGGRKLEELRRILGEDWGSAWGDCENSNNSGDDDDDDENDETSVFVPIQLPTEAPLSPSDFWGGNNNDIDDSMQEVPCTNPDGSLSVPQEFLGDDEDNFFRDGDDNFWGSGNVDYDGGRKRILTGMTLPKALRRILGKDNMWGTAWEDCKSVSDGGDDDDEEDFGGNDTNPGFVPPPHDGYHDNHEKIPSIGFLPEPFSNKDERNVVGCWVSVALPKVSGEEETNYRGAKYFQMKVAKAMAEVIEFATKFQVFKVKGGIVYNRRSNSYSKPAYHVDHPPQINDNRLILIHERVLSNFTKVGETDDAIWWKYYIAFFTIADDHNSVGERLENVIEGAITSGVFEARLQDKYERLVGVSIPGEERLEAPELPPIFVVPEPSDDDLNQSWGLSEWIGLSLFSGTLISITFLGLTGRHRQKKLEEQENWGVKIATEKDINELLSYGWKYNGSKVIAFDKSKIIYRDDDSMLIGGALPNSEIRCAPTEVMTTMTGSIPTGLSANISRSGLSRGVSVNSLQSKDLTQDTGSASSNGEDS